MTREEAIDFGKMWLELQEDSKNSNTYKFFVVAIKALEQEPILDKIRAEIEEKIEQEDFARSVFRHEEKETVKADQCTGSIFAYNNVIKLIDKYKAESEDKE